MITLNEYNLIEKIQRNNTPSIIIEDFTPKTFFHANNDLSINSKKDLFKFASSMHDNSSLTNEKINLLGDISSNNYDIIKSFVKDFILFEKIKLKKKTSFINSVIDAMITVKSILKLFPLNNRAGGGVKILDVGSGSGYVSALLARCGYTVFAYEVAKPFFIFQSELFNFLFNKDFKVIKNLKNIGQFKKINLIPWWIFCNYDKFKLKNIDVVIINNAINELEPRQILYINRMIEKNKENEYHPTYLMINGTGVNKYNNFNKLSAIGFVKIHEPQKKYDKIFLFKKKFNKNTNFLRENNIFAKLKYTIIYLIKKIIPNFLHVKRLKILSSNKQKEININLIQKLNKDLNVNLMDNSLINYLKFIYR